MTRNLEEIVRSAQELQADRAVHAERVRAALPRRAARVARRRRAGMFVGVTAAAAVAAAVVVPTVLLRPDGAAQHQAGAPGGPASPAPVSTAVNLPAAGTEVAPLALRYRLSWLPAGVRERLRTASPPDVPDGFVLRSWTKNKVGPTADAKGARIELMVSDATARGALQANGGVQVDVGGKVGYYHGPEGDRKSYLEWQPDKDTVLSVSQQDLDLSRADLLRAARSVVPDTARVAVPLAVPPAFGLVGHVAFGGDSASSWQVSASGVATDRRQLSVSVGFASTAPAGGEKITVGGRPARLVVRKIEGPAAKTRGATGTMFLVVELGGGRLLTVVGDGMPRAEFLALAEGIRVTGVPDTSWLTIG
ncbi:MAG TPA: hypothetical protein VES42_21645 [Pilimelia sp.]|nr:hypothetical protein [Pilimelia sp.]